MKDKEIYICSQCGAKSLQWKGQCGSCRAWNSFQAVVERPDSGRRRGEAASGRSASCCLAEVSEKGETPFGTGMGALDRVLGRGLVPGAAILIGGEPGIGKSTLLLQVCGSVAAGSGGVLYVSAEESLGQLKARAERLGALHPRLKALSSTHVEDIFPVLEEEPPALVVVDSVQMLNSARVDGFPGSPSQVRAVATELIEACKKCGATLFLVGHVTKDGQIAGPKLLEHMVDTVISLEGERGESFRLLRVLKNRFGPNQELLVFQMAQRGLEVVEDPSTFFLDARNAALSGTAVVMVADGQRPFAVEVQALVTRSFLSIPRRAALGFDVNRLHLLLAVLEKRLRLNFGQVDIYTKVGGGLRLSDPGLDLGLIAAVLSSFYDLPLPERAVFFGEVDLNGQIRPVTAQDIRLSQAERLGYAPVFCAGGGKAQGGATIMDLQRMLFRKQSQGGKA